MTFTVEKSLFCGNKEKNYTYKAAALLLLYIALHLVVAIAVAGSINSYCNYLYGSNVTSNIFQKLSRDTQTHIFFFILKQKIILKAR